MSETGYIYRIPETNGWNLTQLINKTVGQPGWTFGGAILWDFEPVMKSANLRPIKQIGQTYIDISGDFGHAFSQHAEVRWKRRGKEGYDVLVLSEQTQDETLQRVFSKETEETRKHRQLGESWKVQTNDELKIMQTGPNSRRLRYKTYHAPNGAVQFVRYTEVNS
ncbi:MAG: hypothetical protein GFH27_549285n31 [Chloroflexi bacterium AL-W]|nr:hypothetical protein [Chloroflexi bacterium AL-N1]NOK65543.1 hypothetical protein [Chloroflexi bacterium AL-N10]NOK74515.1 hypothetical protein [Chloroflexi bacterium AL-N5]NOK80576.1 hypothetical protein [Chloroflexi bacterium AL-W]NOK88773.1 hypothetical protein [Chloroflexi bacterium AL-N15]